jgi:hypothetical protein
MTGIHWQKNKGVSITYVLNKINDLRSLEERHVETLQLFKNCLSCYSRGPGISLIAADDTHAFFSVQGEIQALLEERQALMDLEGICVL